MLILIFHGSVGGSVTAPVQIIVVGGNHPTFGSHGHSAADVHGQVLRPAMVTLVKVVAGRGITISQIIVVADLKGGSKY